MKRNQNSRVVTALLSLLAAAAIASQQVPIRAEAAPTVMPDGGIFDAAYYAGTYPDAAASVGTKEDALYRHYETCGRTEGRLPYDPEAEVYFLEGEPAGTILPDPIYTDEEVTRRILSLKSAFPEGLTWKGGTHLYDNLQFPTCGAGCVSFAMQVSDLVYGKDAKVVRLAPERVSRIKPGDILRVRKNTHSVVVIRVDGDVLTLCEGNYYGTVHWGRKIKVSSLAGDITYVERRYVMHPEGTAAAAP